MSRLSCILSVLFVSGAVLGVCGCSTSLGTRVPRDVDFSGEWQIDLALSDFPQEAVKAPPPITGTADAGDSGGPVSGQAGGRGRGGRGRGGGAGPGEGGFGGGLGGARPGSPERHFAMPPHLAVSQSATGLNVNITMPDGKLVANSYASGEKSVVSTSRGPANRTLGWEGDDYVIRTQVGEKGPQSEVRYSLDRGGMLSVTTTITHSGIYDFQYTLEYDRVTP